MVSESAKSGYFNLLFPEWQGYGSDARLTEGVQELAENLFSMNQFFRIRTTSFESLEIEHGVAGLVMSLLIGVEALCKGCDMAELESVVRGQSWSEALIVSPIDRSARLQVPTEAPPEAPPKEAPTEDPNEAPVAPPVVPAPVPAPDESPVPEHPQFCPLPKS